MDDEGGGSLSSEANLPGGGRGRAIQESIPPPKAGSWVAGGPTLPSTSASFDGMGGGQPTVPSQSPKGGAPGTLPGRLGGGGVGKQGPGGVADVGLQPGRAPVLQRHVFRGLPSPAPGAALRGADGRTMGSHRWERSCLEKGGNQQPLHLPGGGSEGWSEGQCPFTVLISHHASPPRSLPIWSGHAILAVTELPPPDSTRVPLKSLQHDTS